MTQKDFIEKWENAIMAHFCRVSFDGGGMPFWARMKAIRKELVLDLQSCYREGHKLPAATSAPATIPMMEGVTK